MKINLQIAPKFKEVFLSKAKNIVLYSPRAAGKSFVAYDLAIAYMIKYPNHDIAIARANANSLRDSCYAEVLSRISKYNVHRLLRGVVSPPKIHGANNVSYFLGIGGPDKNRTRSFMPSNKLSLIIVEETQSLKDEESLTHAMSSLTRHLDENINSHVVYLGNNPDTESHWWYKFKNNHKSNPNSLVIESTYLDIYHLLGESLKDEINFLKEVNTPEYERVYLGKFNTTQDRAVYNFKEHHYIDKIPDDERIWFVYLGVDGAIRRDKTAVVPIAVSRTNRMYVLPSFIHDPTIGGVLSSRDQSFKIHQYLYKTMVERWGFLLPHKAIVDNAAADLILELRARGIETVQFNDKKTEETLEKLNTFFGANQIFIIKSPTNDQLIKEIQENTFINKKLNPSIPNDALDALRYGVFAIYKEGIKPHLTR